MSKEIADRVYEAIEKSELEDDEIAPLVKKSQSTVNRWRNKKTTNYPKSTLKIIANALDVNYEWLRFGTGSMKSDPKDVPLIANPDEIDPEAFGSLSLDEMIKYLEHIQSLSQNVLGSLKRLKNGISSHK